MTLFSRYLRLLRTVLLGRLILLASAVLSKVPSRSKSTLRIFLSVSLSLGGLLEWICASSIMTLREYFADYICELSYHFSGNNGLIGQYSIEDGLLSCRNRPSRWASIGLLAASGPVRTNMKI